MKTILLATDFSDASVGACEYGLKLADYLNAKVILFSAYHTISPAGFDTPAFLDIQDIKQNVDRQLLDQARSLDDTRRQDFYTDSLEGPVVQTILRKIKESKAELLVVGMKHDHKKLRKIIGSTVTGLIKDLPVPMIVVPEGTKFQKIESIAVAVQADIGGDVNPRQIEILNEIGSRFNARAFIVKVSRNKTEEAFALLYQPNRLSKLLRTTNPLFESISDSDSGEGLLKFVQNNHIDLLGLFPHDHSIFESLAHTSFTRRMIYEANLPLIIFPKQVL